MTSRSWGRVGTGQRVEPDGKAAVRAYFHRLINERDLSVCDDLLASDYRDHDAPPGAPPGAVGTKEFVADFLRDYPDLWVDIEDIVAEGDRLAARLVWRGTHKDSGRPYYQMGIVMVRLNREGQLAERWSAYAPVQ